MDEKVMEQVTTSTERLVAAAEALQLALAAISAQQQEIEAKIDRIVAAIEERPLLVQANNSTLAKEARMGHPRKTLSPMVTMILAKSGVDDVNHTAVLDKALGTLTPEQRIAVKTEMARAGLIQ
jgi:cysteine sulfinate desulfinase/cysteine desulfurase-like protein